MYFQVSDFAGKLYQGQRLLLIFAIEGKEKEFYEIATMRKFANVITDPEIKAPMLMSIPVWDRTLLKGKEIRAHCYKTFFVLNLRTFVIS